MVSSTNTYLCSVWNTFCIGVGSFVSPCIRQGSIVLPVYGSGFVSPCIRPPLEDTSPFIRVGVRNISPLYECRRKNHCFRKPTEDEQQEALDNAVDLLDLCAPAYAVVAHLRRCCGISRSAAYRDVQDAEDIRRQRGYEPQNSACESLELSQRLLV